LRWILALILVAVLLLFVSTDVGIYVDYLWYRSEGMEQVFFATIRYEATAFFVFGVVALLFFAANLVVARRFSGARRDAAETIVSLPGAARHWVTLLIVPAAVVVGILFGSGASSAWQTITLAQHPVSFGVQDPVLQRSVSWYVFQLPYLQFLYSWSVGLLVITALGAGALYALAAPGFVRIERALGDYGPVHVSFSPPPAIIAHGAVLLGLFFLARAAAYHWISSADLLFSQHSTAFGANFTDVHVRLPAYSILAGVLGLCMVCCILGAVRRSLGWLVAAPVLWISVAIVSLGLIPAIVQAVFVAATELQRETPYITNSIAATRAAFGLDGIATTNPTVQPLATNDVQQNPQTVQNVRVWDWRPLLETYQQLQGLRPYYVFPDVDVDRYGGKQIMLATRELDISRLPPAAQNWQNEHLVYTHGYGVVASSANGATSQGTPDLVLSNIPPATDDANLKVTKPDVYFTSGASSTDWVLVKTSSKEFDYPSGNDNAYTSYAGKAGIGVGSLGRRVLFAWYLGDPLLLYTSYIQPDSKVLIRRQISDMVHKITPYITLDKDPYMVIINGKLYWFMDGYTTTDRYPYSASLASGTNYIRNSVKIIVDAYDGTVNYYRTDDAAHPEPIIQAYSELFPGLFQPLSNMPPEFRAHLRYPEDLLQAQATTLAVYHVTDPNVFYNREDVWAIPSELSGQNQTPIAPYYVQVRLPGESQAEFVLIQPFVPRGKDNMIGWLAARSDPAHYGQVLLYEFSKDSLIYGPSQIEARINQDTTISSSLTLWNQQGSRVIRGNLLVIPLGQAFLYVEPVFLQAEQGQIPELKRVILATSTTVTMQVNFASALQALFTGAPSAGVSPTGAPAAAGGATPEATPTVAAASTPAGPVATPGSTAAVAQDALNHYNQAQADLKAGDWAGYGTELAAMQRDLQQLAGR